MRNIVFLNYLGSLRALTSARAPSNTMFMVKQSFRDMQIMLLHHNKKGGP